MSLHTIKVSIHLPDGYQLPETGGTYISFKTPHASLGGARGSNQMPSQIPWIASFTVDGDVATIGEEFSVTARIDGASPLSLNIPHTFIWNGGDQEVEITLSPAPVSTIAATEPFSFGA